MVAREAAWEAWDPREDGVSALPLRLVSPIDWEHDDDRDLIRIHLDRLERETWYKKRVRPILEGLEAGDDLPGLARRMVAAQPDWSSSRAARSARRLVSSLASQGNVEIVLPPVPEVLNDRFVRVRELGRGGMGVAWLCEDLERDHQPVVVKHAWNWSGPLEVRDHMIREEAKVLERVRHPAVVPFVDGFELEGRFHLARGFVEGVEVSDHVFKHGPPSPEERIRITRETADILAHLHDRNILCLDVKPSNLMIEEGTGRILVADLGHGRSFDGDRLELGGAWGSRAFSAPEVHSEHVADPRSDVYGLGCAHTFLIREKAPRSDETWEDLAAALRAAGATRTEIAFLREALRDDPEERPGTMREVLELLPEG